VLLPLRGLKEVVTMPQDEKQPRDEMERSIDDSLESRILDRNQKYLNNMVYRQKQYGSDVLSLTYTPGTLMIGGGVLSTAIGLFAENPYLFLGGIAIAGVKITYNVAKIIFGWHLEEDDGKIHFRSDVEFTDYGCIMDYWNSRKQVKNFKKWMKKYGTSIDYQERDREIFREMNPGLFGR
jgi:hypothetical protein